MKYVPSAWLLGVTSLVACNLVADLEGYEVVEGPPVGGAGGAGAAGGIGGGHGGGGRGGGSGGQGGELVLPCGDTCTGEHLWTRHFTGQGDEWVTASAVDQDDGAIYVGGEFVGDITLEGDTYTSPDSERDLFVVKLSDAGDVLWSLSSVSSSMDDDHLSGLTIDTDGGIVGVGYFEGGLNLDGNFMDASTTFDVLLFKVMADKSFAWVEQFGGSSNVRAFGVATHPEGGVIVVGEFGGDFDLGGGPLTNISSTDGFIAHFDENGAHVWSQAVGGAGVDSVVAVAATPDDGFVVLGRSFASADLGGGPLPHVGDMDIFIAKYDAFAVHQWSRAFGGTAKDEAFGLAVDEAGRVFVVGEFRDTLALGGELLISAGDADAFWLVLDAGGEHISSAAFGDAAFQTARAVSGDTFANALIGGHFRGAIDLGGGDFESGGDDDDIFVAKLSFDGNYRYASPFGSPGPENQRVDRISHGADGSGILAGTFDGTVNFGGGPKNAIDGDDIYVVKLAK